MASKMSGFMKGEVTALEEQQQLEPTWPGTTSGTGMIEGLRVLLDVELIDAGRSRRQGVDEGSLE